MSSSARTLPRSRRGQATRAALLRGARSVFEDVGFLDAKITDITAAAGVATGSFYTYFNDKDEVLAALLEELEERMLHPGVHHAQAEDAGPFALIEEANRAYLTAYRDNAGLMALLEQVAMVDAGFARIRRERAEAFYERNARSIERLQREGVADPELDPVLASIALSSMVSRTAHAIFATRLREDVDLDALVSTLTRLWVNAITKKG